MPLEVLFEDNHLLVVNKPALLPTMGAEAGKDSLVNRCKRYLKQRYQKPGNVYLGVVNRLDAPVTGVIAFARTSKAAARLSAQFRNQQVWKTYWALVEGPRQPLPEATLIDWLVHDDAQRRVRVVPASGQSHQMPGAKRAKLTYRLLSRTRLGYLLSIQLATGRKHQIRAQLSHAGMPIVGDRNYGSQRSFLRGIALHSQSLSLVHPVRLERLEFQINPPEYWQLPSIDLR